MIPKQWRRGITYDPFGNVTTSGTGNFQPGYNSNNQMQGPATYDADGQATNDEEHTYSWDAFGDPITIDGMTVTYDALGRAVEYGSGAAYTQIQYSPLGVKMQLLSPQGLTAYAPFPGGAEGVWSPNAMYYRHGDWLGSSRFASTSSRTVYYDAAYAPFGEPYAESGTTDRDFTGMDQSMVSGLYDFPAREYNSLEGRWPSPDPAGIASVNPADPQTWNRYAYVRNSPLQMTDPTGLQGDDEGFACGWFYLSGEWTGSECDPIFTDPQFCNLWDFSGCLSWYPGQPLIYPVGGGGGGSGTPAPPAAPAAPSVNGSQPQVQTPAQAATNYCQQHGQLSFNIPFTHIPVTISLSATAFVNFSTTNDVSATFPPSAGLSLDITAGAPSGPNVPFQVGLGKNASAGTFLTPNGPSGFSLSIPLSPVAGSPVTPSPNVGNVCGMVNGGG